MLTTTIPRTTATADRFRVETWQLDHPTSAPSTVRAVPARGRPTACSCCSRASVREGTDLGAVIAAAAASLGVKPEAFYAAIKAALYAVGQADGLLPSGADVTVK